MKKMIVFIILITLLSTFHAHSKQEWGKVEPEILTMDFFPDDPEADAVVLFDVGRITITKSFNQIYERHRRVKIMTERGKKYADVSIGYWGRDKFKKFEAHTILPGGKKIKLGKKMIFEEEEGNWKAKKFTFPAVDVGSVIEYRFEIFSKYITYLEPWYFQNEEYTELSELTVEIPRGMNYWTFYSGLSGDKPEPVRSEFRDINTGAKTFLRCTWRLEDLEAVREEPYMTNISDHMLALFFQLESYQDRYVNLKFIRSWDDLAEEASGYFRALMDEDEGLKDKAEAMITDDLTDEDKAKVIYNFVKDGIEMINSRKIFSIKRPHEVMEEMEGGPVAKNVLLINLLRHVGLEAGPVLISTKDHGLFREDWVRLHQFNHLLVCLQIGEKTYMLDTSDKYCPFGTLPINDLAGMGFYLHGDGGEIIDVPLPDRPSQSKIETNAEIDEEGSLSCHSELTFSGYYGVRQSKILSEKGEKEYIDEMARERFGDVEVDSFRVEGQENLDEPFVVSIDYRLPAYAQVVGDMMYLSPPLLRCLESNPFKREERKYPVEYDYRTVNEEMIKLDLPEGYRVVEVPPSIYENPRGLLFTSKITTNGNSVQFRRRLEKEQLVYYPRDYKLLRDFFACVVESDKGQIVLSR